MENNCDYSCVPFKKGCQNVMKKNNNETSSDMREITLIINTIYRLFGMDGKNNTRC